MGRHVNSHCLGPPRPAPPRPVFDAYVVPESRQVARGPAGKDGVIDFSRPHGPLLIIGGERDNIVPWQLNEKNFEDAAGRRWTGPARAAYPPIETVRPHAPSW